MNADAPIEAAALAEHLRNALDDGKAVDIVVLDVTALTSITDYMIIASGRSARQAKALTSRIREAAAAVKVPLIGVEGEISAEWMLADLGDVVVHIMQPATREFYQLEKLWEERPRSQAEAL